jgi:predicted nuclease with RNAse H fold
VSIEEEHVVTVTSGEAMSIEEEHVVTVSSGEAIVTVSLGEAISVEEDKGAKVLVFDDGRGAIIAGIELEEDDVELHPVVVVERGDDGDGERESTVSIEEEHVVTVTSGDAIVTVPSGEAISVEEDKGAVVLVFDDGRGEIMLTDRIHLLSQTVEEKRDGSNEGERGESKGGATEAAMGSRDPGRASSC